MRKLAQGLLALAEVLFLKAHGWTKSHGDWWLRPDDYDPNRNGGAPYRRGHAVNSQKWTNAHTWQAMRDRARRAEDRGLQ